MIAIVAPLEHGAASGALLGLTSFAGLFAVQTVLVPLGEAWIARSTAPGEALFADLPPRAVPVGGPVFDPERPTAVLLVTGHHRFGMESLLVFWRTFRTCFDQVQIVGVPARGEDPAWLARTLQGYRAATRAMDLAARVQVVDDPDDPERAAERRCLRIAESCRSVVFLSGEPEPPLPFWNLLPDAVCGRVLRRLRRRGLATAGLAVRVEKKKAAAGAAAFSG